MGTMFFVLVQLFSDNPSEEGYATQKNRTELGREGRFVGANHSFFSSDFFNMVKTNVICTIPQSSP